MAKQTAHLRKVQMPGALKPSVPESTHEFATDFGFKPQQRTSLEDAYEFWQRNRTADNVVPLLRAAAPVIDKALTTYAGGDKALRTRAKQLVLDAFDTYDPKQGTKLRTHLMVRLQPLRRDYLQRVTPVAVPERVQQDRYRLEQAERMLNDELGREPSDDELADNIGLSQRRIAHVRKFSRGTLLEGQLLSPEGEQLLPGASRLSAEDTWVEYVHHDLDPLDKKILEWKTGLYGKQILSNNEIAKRLRLSPGAVSQRAAKIAMRIEEGAGNGLAIE